MKKAIYILIILLIMNCVPQGAGMKFNLLNVGMTDKDVVNVVGNPDRVIANNDKKIFVYNDTEDWNPVYYVAVFENGVLFKFGRSDDFDNTPRLRIDQNINSNVNIKSR